MLSWPADQAATPLLVLCRSLPDLAWLCVRRMELRAAAAPSSTRPEGFDFIIASLVACMGN